MRALADQERINRFLEALGRAARRVIRVYLVGGTTAVLLGWRLQLNVELTSPADFIPVPDGWEDRRTFITQVGRVSFYHSDLYAQALAKVERGHQQDPRNVREMISRGLIDPEKARAYFARIEPALYRFPAVHAPAFRAAVDEAFRP